MTAEYRPGSALIVVDVQNDFADPAGALYVPGGDDVVAAVNDEIAAAVAAGAVVVCTQDWHPPTTPHFVTEGGPWPVHCVRHTWGAELHPGLQVEGEIVRKGVGGEDGYSGFTMRDPVTAAGASTGLDELLRDRGVERVVVVGLAYDVCVKATALDAARLGYDCVVPRREAAIELAPGDADRATGELERQGVVVA